MPELVSLLPLIVPFVVLGVVIVYDCLTANWWVDVDIDSYIGRTSYESDIEWLHKTRKDAILYAAKLRIRGIKVHSVRRFSIFGKGRNVLDVGKIRLRVPLHEGAIYFKKWRAYRRDKELRPLFTFRKKA